jgi:hypothetical protein
MVQTRKPIDAYLHQDPNRKDCHFGGEALRQHGQCQANGFRTSKEGIPPDQQRFLDFDSEYIYGGTRSDSNIWCESTLLLMPLISQYILNHLCGSYY